MSMRIAIPESTCFGKEFGPRDRSLDDDQVGVPLAHRFHGLGFAGHGRENMLLSAQERAKNTAAFRQVVGDQNASHYSYKRLCGESGLLWADPGLRKARTCGHRRVATEENTPPAYRSSADHVVEPWSLSGCGMPSKLRKNQALALIRNDLRRILQITPLILLCLDTHPVWR